MVSRRYSSVGSSGVRTCQIPNPIPNSHCDTLVAFDLISYYKITLRRVGNTSPVRNKAGEARFTYSKADFLFKIFYYDETGQELMYYIPL